MKTLRVTVLALALLVSTVVPVKAQFDEVGSIDFPTSVTGEAQHYFLRGVAILHSFVGLADAHRTSIFKGN